MGSFEQQSAVVLVADDDPLIRTVLRMALTTRGHQVIEARDSIEARAAASAEPSGIDVVVLDMNMPGGAIDETVAQLRAIAPLVPILILSGDPLPSAALAEVSIDFAQKPVDLDEFLSRIDLLLAVAHKTS